jgi:hypothetical protein
MLEHEPSLKRRLTNDLYTELGIVLNTPKPKKKPQT